MHTFIYFNVFGSYFKFNNLITSQQVCYSITQIIILPRCGSLSTTLSAISHSMVLQINAQQKVIQSPSNHLFIHFSLSLFLTCKVQHSRETPYGTKKQKTELFRMVWYFKIGTTKKLSNSLSSSIPTSFPSLISTTYKSLQLDIKLPT